MQQPTVTFHPVKTALASGQDQTLDVLVRVTPPAWAHTPTRLPVNVALVIDRSGSMGGEKIETAKRVALAALDRLAPHDRFSVVAFDSEVQVVLPSVTGSQTAHARELISSVRASGGTALHEGWLQGALQVAEHLRPGQLSRVLLLSDGEANVGLTDRHEIAEQVRGLAARGVSTSTFGIGNDYDETLMEGLANAGDGNASYVRHAHQLEQLFDREFQGLASLFGRGVSLGVEPNETDGVRLVEVLNDLELNRTGRYRLPNLQPGQPLEVVLRLRVPAGTAGEVQGVTRVRLAWDDPKTGKRYKTRVQLNLPVLTPAAVESLPSDTDVQAKVASLEIARRKVEAAEALRSGNHERAAAALLDAGSFAASAPAVPSMAREHAELDELQRAMQNRDDALARKLASSQAYNRRRNRE